MKVSIAALLRNTFALSISALLLTACASMSQADKNWSRPGSFKVRHNNELVLYDFIQERDVQLQVTWPSGKGPYPVVVFSHGAFCYPQQYARVTDSRLSGTP